jgi:UDP-N-acetylmuramate: L-alanyl-gamma-D-glutamyl-meso-diaminopimelate ligase
VFEPRTNTSRRAIFQEEYAAALSGAGVIFVREPQNTDAIAEADRFSAGKLARDLSAAGKEARSFRDADELLIALEKLITPGDVALFMSTGDLEDLPMRLARAIEEKDHERGKALRQN